jgi:hypothetical protein
MRHERWKRKLKGTWHSTSPLDGSRASSLSPYFSTFPGGRFRGPRAACYGDGMHRNQFTDAPKIELPEVVDARTLAGLLGLDADCLLQGRES